MAANSSSRISLVTPTEKTWNTWWRHQMETFSALLAFFGGNSPFSSVNFPHKGQWLGTLVFTLMNKQLSKQSRRQWFKTPSRPLWPHYNEKYIMILKTGSIHLLSTVTTQRNECWGQNGRSFAYDISKCILLILFLFLLKFHRILFLGSNWQYVGNRRQAIT